DFTLAHRDAVGSRPPHHRRRHTGEDSSYGRNIHERRGLP
ncbi:hypothetical protein ATR1_118d0001, partial [Acetobacter tropicalis]